MNSEEILQHVRMVAADMRENDVTPRQIRMSNATLREFEAGLDNQYRYISGQSLREVVTVYGIPVRVDPLMKPGEIRVEQ